MTTYSNPFNPIPDTTLLIADFKVSPQKRIIIIRGRDNTIDDPWTTVPGTTIILIGGRPTEDEIRRYFTATPSARFDLNLSGSTNNRLRDYLGILRSGPGRPKAEQPEG